MSVDEEREPMQDDSASDQSHFSQDHTADLAADAPQDEDGAGASSQIILGLGEYSADEVNDQVFEELRLHGDAIREAQAAWAAFQRAAESPEAAAEAIYAAIFDCAPNLQALFKTPRAVMAMKIMRGVTCIVSTLPDPKALKILAEALGFQHLDFDVNVPRVALFRDAIVDTLASELGVQLTNAAREVLKVALNYVGGALIYVRRNYANRLKVLATSWATANKRQVKLKERSGDGGDQDAAAAERSPEGAAATQPKAAGTKRKRAPKGLEILTDAGSRSNNASDRGREDRGNIAVPTTFPEMFRFNAAVMGFADNGWMTEVLSAFDAIVRNVANSYRLQEECDVLALRLSKCFGPIDLGEFKAVMLASLRSLVPKGWDSEHEVAWSWLWQNVERLLGAQMGKPARQERALAGLMSRLEGTDMAAFRNRVYATFFELAPAGMDYFKQSATRLHFVAEKVFGMTLDMYRQPDELVNELSASGLRHVGYGIPSELCAPFTNAYVSVLRTVTDDEEASEAFQWSLSLISRILARVINEGSTMVMRAINANSGKLLDKAVACASRSERGEWVLSVTVGSQSISPLLWAVETGALEAAEAILRDLLTIRADRDRYYYGVDLLFERHPDIIRRLCFDAPGLLPTLLDGLIWRSRLTERGRRRTVYFVKHLLVQPDGEFAQAIDWITQNQDPKIACHPVVSYVIDLVWTGVAARAFLFRKAWLLMTTTVFMLSQTILNSGIHDGVSECVWIRAAILACRCFIYMVSWPSLAATHISRGRVDIRTKNFVRIWWFRIPAHFLEFNSMVSLALCMILFIMLTLCPIVHCLGQPSADGRHLLFTERCDEGDQYLSTYAFFSMAGMLCYWALLMDLSVFSNRVSAFALIFGHVLSEVGLFVLGLSFLVFACACATVALKVDEENFITIPRAGMCFVQMFLGMTSSEEYEAESRYPVLFAPIVFFVFTAKVYMVSLLVAQLAGAYNATFEDMLGWARLKRGEVCVASMGSVPRARWDRFVASLRLEEPCEFGEGDVGMPGALQMTEPAGANVTTADMIRRFGGSTSPDAVWPEDEAKADDAQDRLERVETLMKRIMKRMDTVGKQRGSSALGSSALSAKTGSSCNTSDLSGGQHDA